MKKYKVMEKLIRYDRWLGIRVGIIGLVFGLLSFIVEVFRQRSLTTLFSVLALLFFFAGFAIQAKMFIEHLRKRK
jgi:4-hydroxybenzoate polyprenyltransferase